MVGFGERRRLTLLFALLVLSAALVAVVGGPLALIVGELLRRGADQNALTILLVAPIAVTAIVFLRVIVGVDTLGIFAPMLLAIAFMRIGILSGLVLLAVLVLIGAPCLVLMERYRFLAIARTGVLICLVALVLLAATLAGAVSGTTALLEAQVIPLAIMAGVIERFVNAQVDQRPEESAKLLLTAVAATLVSLLIGNEPFQALLFRRPDAALLAVPACLVMGRYAGLRLTDLARFREVARGATG